MSETEQRLIDLETKVSYQEVQIEELRETVHEQYLLVELLQKELKTILDRLQSDNSPSAPSIINEKPPHY